MRQLIAVALATLALPATALADASTTDQTLSVVGHGVTRVAPDVADLSLTVSSRQRTALAARNTVNTRTRSLVDAIVALGVPAAAVQTQDTGLSRDVRRVHGKRVVSWVASSTTTVHITDLSKISPVLDTATRLGASGFDGPNFGFSNPSAGSQAAEAAALADARARADAAAAAVGLHVIGVRSIDLDPESGVGAASGAATAAPAPAKSVPTPISPGTMEVDADVAVVFLLGS